MNILSAEEQQEFSLCYILEDEGVMKPLRNDEYIMDVTTQLESRRRAANNGEEGDYLLILTRAVWLQPLRRDSQLYVDALFFQLMPNYISGLMTPLGKGGVVSATLMVEWLYSLIHSVISFILCTFRAM